MSGAKLLRVKDLRLIRVKQNKMSRYDFGEREDEANRERQVIGLSGDEIGEVK